MLGYMLVDSNATSQTTGRYCGQIDVASLIANVWLVYWFSFGQLLSVLALDHKFNMRNPSW